MAGRCDMAVLDAARRIKAEWQRDRKTHEQRLAHRRALDEDVPRLEQAALAAETEAKKARALADDVLADDLSLAQLRTILREVCPNTPTGAPDQIATALQGLRPRAMLLADRASDARRRASDTRDQARRGLIDTAATELHKQIDRLREQLQSLGARMRGRQPMLDAPGQIADQRRVCEGIASGTRALGVEYKNFIWQPVDARQAYLSARERLENLRTLAAGHDAAVKANEQDRRAEAAIYQKVETTMEKMLLPENMRWSD